LPDDAATLALPSVMFAITDTFDAPTAVAGPSRLAEVKIALISPISTSTMASPVSPTRTRCIAWAESCCNPDFIIAVA
jgi:hypothetical protein